MTALVPARSPVPGPADGGIDLAIGGMTCAACARRVERTLNTLDGVQATVDFATGYAHVRHPDALDAAAIVARVEAAGFTARLPDPSRARPAAPDPARELLGRLLGTAVLALPVVVLSMVPALQFTYWQWVALVLTAPVVVEGALPFHRAAWTNLRHGTATVDTLVSVGTLAAFGWSAYALLWGTAGTPGMTHGFALTVAPTGVADAVYLEVAAGVPLFVLAGRWVEARSRRAAGAALRALLDLGATEVSIRTPHGERRVPIGELAVGDVFLVRPGETVAADGVVRDGRSTVDMSPVTGESVPVDVVAGDDVVGGCTNGSGLLVVRAERVGADTRLARIGRLVAAAQSGKAAVARLADRVAGVFVPVVVGLAVATLGYWLGSGSGAETAVGAAVAVLVVACPCALGLATPVALLVGTGRGAQLGVLIKGPEVLESTRRVDTVVLDKTGTVTTGRMAVRDVHTADGVEPDDVLRLAGAVEHGSEHPIGAAIAAAARERFGELPGVGEFDGLPGLGVRGLVAELTAPEGRQSGGQAVVVAHAVLVGRPALLAEHGVELDEALARRHGEVEASGATAVVVAWDGVPRGVVAVSDSVRPGAADAVARLRALGLRTMLLTGDNAAVAAGVAAVVGIDADAVVAGVAPEGKVAAVAALRAEGRVVAMVGDGINDAAALAAADLGLAVGSGSDVAIEASDVTLVRGDLAAAVDAIRLARRTLAVIKGNLFWAFAYNVVALPLAACGLLDPMVAGLAMACSSVFVVTNSLRLRRFAGVQRP